MSCRCDSDRPCPNVVAVPYDTKDFMVQCGLCGQYTNILKGLKALQVSFDSLLYHEIYKQAQSTVVYKMLSCYSFYAFYKQKIQTSTSLHSSSPYLHNTRLTVALNG